MHTPATQRASMVFRVELALKAFENIANIGETVPFKRQSRIG